MCKGMGWRNLQDVAREGCEREPLHHAEDGGQLELVWYFNDEGYAVLKCPVCSRHFLVEAEGCNLPEGVIDRDTGLDGPVPTLNEDGTLVGPYDSEEEREAAMAEEQEQGWPDDAAWDALKPKAD